MLPEPPEDKDSSPAGPDRRPGPSRFLVPAGQRVADDHDSAVSAASFLSRDKIVGKLTIPSPAAMSPSSKPISETVQNGNVHPSSVAKKSEVREEPKPKRGRGRPRKDRNSLPLPGYYL